MFHSTKLACPPDAVISASVGSSPSRRPSLGERRRSPQTTAAPSAARRLAIARPRPLEAPETIATSPSRRPHPRMPGSGVDIDVQLAERRRGEVAHCDDRVVAVAQRERAGTGEKCLERDAELGASQGCAGTDVDAATEGEMPAVGAIDARAERVVELGFVAVRYIT